MLSFDIFFLWPFAIRVCTMEILVRGRVWWRTQEEDRMWACGEAQSLSNWNLQSKKLPSIRGPSTLFPPVTAWALLIWSQGGIMVLWGLWRWVDFLGVDFMRCLYHLLCQNQHHLQKFLKCCLGCLLPSYLSSFSISPSSPFSSLLLPSSLPPPQFPSPSSLLLASFLLILTPPHYPLFHCSFSTRWLPRNWFRQLLRVTLPQSQPYWRKGQCT